MNVRPRVKAKLPCPSCQHPYSLVIDGRAVETKDGFRRKRHCPNCKAAYFTLETFERMAKPANRKKLVS